MTHSLKATALAAAFAVAGVGARAEVMIESAGWQAARPGRGQAVAFQDAAELPVPVPGLVLKLRGKAALKNRGPKAAEGLLLRYAVAARLARTDVGSPTPGVWAVPFLLDERRVAKIPPNQVMAVPLAMSPTLEAYLKRLKRHGQRAEALRLQVMIEPRVGFGVQTAESVAEFKP